MIHATIEILIQRKRYHKGWESCPESQTICRISAVMNYSFYFPKYIGIWHIPDKVQLICIHPFMLRYLISLYDRAYPHSLKCL